MTPVKPEPQAQAAPQRCAPPAAQRPPLVDSTELLRGGRAIEIAHNGELYRLQATRQGKLILTK